MLTLTPMLTLTRCALRPRVPRSGEPFPPHGAIAAPGYGLLDTGNAASTMVDPQTARACGIAADASLPHQTIRGVNGVQSYPMAIVRMRIRGFERVIAVAIGGTQGALVGEDMLGPMFDAGYTVAGFYGQRRSAAGGVQWLQSA